MTNPHFSDEEEDFELNIYSAQRLQSEIDEHKEDELFKINEKPNDDDYDFWKETKNE